MTTINYWEILDSLDFLDVHYFIALFKMLNSLLVIASNVMYHQFVWVTEGLQQFFQSDIR